MKRILLIEGILLLFIGLVSMREALLSIIYKNPQTLYDPLGPGFYILLLSGAMMTIGFIHLFINYRKVLSIEKLAVSNELGKRVKRVISMIVVFAIYIFLINIVGYLVATIFFFILEFRIVGIKSWATIVILSLVITAVYYVVFIRYCNIVFPKGIFFR